MSFNVVGQSHTFPEKEHQEGVAENGHPCTNSSTVLRFISGHIISVCLNPTPEGSKGDMEAIVKHPVPPGNR